MKENIESMMNPQVYKICMDCKDVKRKDLQKLHKYCNQHV